MSVAIEWRVKSQWRALPPSDLAWTLHSKKYRKLAPQKARKELSKLKRQPYAELFEFRLRPLAIKMATGAS